MMNTKVTMTVTLSVPTKAWAETFGLTQREVKDDLVNYADNNVREALVYSLGSMAEHDGEITVEVKS